MPADFLHGIETVEGNDGSRPIKRARMSVIGIVGTAPDADGVAWPLNTPVPVYGNRRAVAQLGTRGTLPAALSAILNQIGALIVVVRVVEGASVAGTMSAVAGYGPARTGVHALLRAGPDLGLTPRILIAPSFTSIRPSDGVSGVAVSAGGQGYTWANVAIEGDGVGAGAEAVIVDGAIQAINVFKAGMGYTQANVVITGNGAGAQAAATLGLCRNPVVSNLQGIAQRLRAIIVPDLPNTTTRAAIDYRRDWNSARIYGADPWPRVWDVLSGGLVSMPASPFVAGAIAARDNQSGAHWSPSSMEINGVKGLSRPIDHSLFDQTAESQVLNGADVTTFVREDGFRLFGNRTFSTDPAWTFLSVRRTADLVHESVEKGVAWALDRPFSVRNLVEVADSVNDFIRTLKTEEATLGGKVWFDPAENTKDKILSGQWTYDFDMEPPPPAERITFRVHRNGDYVDDVVTAAAARIAAL